MPTSPLEQEWDALDGPPSRVVTVLVVGCGQRGQQYAAFAKEFPSRMVVVGVAEVVEHRRKKVQDLYAVPDFMCVDNWKEFLIKHDAKLDGNSTKLADGNSARLADAVIISTQDSQHKEPAVAFAKRGYHILLEKPMAVTAQDCRDITETCQENNVMLAVCHVLRYYPPVVKIKELIDSGVIGDVVTINHIENIGFWHFAHSFVRGNWCSTRTSTFSLMAKCCHDIDLLYYWSGQQPWLKIQSIGSLAHFRESNKPAAASDRCHTCAVEESCPYSANKIYLSNPVNSWPMSVVCDIEEAPGEYAKNLAEELKESPYGRCVYTSDNDVCDNQMVNIQFESGMIANLTMTAFTKDTSRSTRVTGTLGELEWRGGPNGPIIHYDFLSKKETPVLPDMVAPKATTTGHQGADFFLINAFTKAVANNDPSLIKSGPLESLASHMMVFEAERTRLTERER